ncbi:hypothetical protein M231_05966 [Tremella mesenterica]|uniref:Uncharacterized protein n=1 Tax=Tremella mesenterica TaxID=5217 RepID=A0A4Q1BGM7_TREME|nr:hypothetical protein M231_05966 [Tremella mesenterica]
MSSYDVPDDIITPAQFRESMKLVRLQIAVPISVLVSMGANLVCALAIKPGLSGINALNPTLLSPNSIMIGLYWAVLYVMQSQLSICSTRETLVHGVGVRFAIANWLMAAWAVCWTLQFFIGAEVVILLNLINLLSIHLTLLYYPVTLKRPLDALFIHAPMTMLLAILFELDWAHNGFVALGWIMKDGQERNKWVWWAVGVVAGANVVAAIWEGIRRNYLLTIASEYLLLALLFSSPRVNPTLPTTALPKPTALLVTLIVCLVLHPVALIAGTAWARTREREGRIRLEEEVERAEVEERFAQEEASRS